MKWHGGDMASTSSEICHGNHVIAYVASTPSKIMVNVYHTILKVKILNLDVWIVEVCSCTVI